MPNDALSLDRGLPTRHLLRAGYRVSQLLRMPEEPLAGMRESYPRLPSNGLFDPDAFRRGERLLQEAGLIEIEDGCVRRTPPIEVLQGLAEEEGCRTLLALLLEQKRPLWLRVAVRDHEVRSPYMPDSVRKRLTNLFPSDEARDAFLMALGHVDPEARHELGRRGEEQVVAACRAQRVSAGYRELADQVQRVSALSDGFGYDVSAPRPRAEADHLEVKTTGRSGTSITFHLSRHQMRVAHRDPRWRLVVVRSVEDALEILGWCGAERLKECWPADADSGEQIAGRWATVEVRLAPDVLTEGLPPLTPAQP